MSSARDDFKWCISEKKEETTHRALSSSHVKTDKIPEETVSSFWESFSGHRQFYDHRKLCKQAEVKLPETFYLEEAGDEGHKVLEHCRSGPCVLCLDI